MQQNIFKLPAYSCWQQLVHSAYGEDARVLLNGVSYTVSVSHKDANIQKMAK